MTIHYTREKNVQILVSLLKAHGIRQVVASPGTTNTAFICSIQNDDYFTIYSSVDERSSAYIACGLAAELGEPVVISCTGATASRNYAPGLTEAYYRKLPVLAITSSQSFSKVGHHVAQVIDRSVIPNDVAKHAVSLPIVKDDDDWWDCEVKVNKALLELKRHGGGPVHINLPTTYTKPFDVEKLPTCRVIERVFPSDTFPKLRGKIAILVGSHKQWSKEETAALEAFCERKDAVVFCDHTSGYKGKHRLLYSLAAAQELFDHAEYRPDTLIHLGEVSGDYELMQVVGGEVWRVSEDGEIRDTFRRLRYVFEMPEAHFFRHYHADEPQSLGYFQACANQLNSVRAQIPELPFSNIWAASQLAHRLPENSTIHFGILNSLRSWNFFELPETVKSASNVGGFGIDGGLSSLLGASLARPDRLYYCVIGDLAFFYDMNCLGNRHVGNNLRILLINNGKGTEFRMYNHHAAYFGESADEFVAAAGHFGNKSPTLVKHYAEDLGFEYLSASSKETFNEVFERFLEPTVTDKPMLFELFVNAQDDSDALFAMKRIETSVKIKATIEAKNLARQVLGTSGTQFLKKMVGRAGGLGGK